ncbi:MAG: hypothetical protein FWF09_07190 [Bacteroidales bacterium]|nr:hypothetical protein [Bacteroidales bacterium]
MQIFISYDKVYCISAQIISNGRMINCVEGRNRFLPAVGMTAMAMVGNKERARGGCATPRSLSCFFFQATGHLE